MFRMSRLMVLSVLVVALVALCAGAALAANPKLPKYSAPVALTAPGQAPEYAILNVYLTKSKIQTKNDPLMEPADLKGMKTLIIIIGGSGKGLGSAGVDLVDEEKRAKALITEARKLKIPVVGMHLGGDARLGENSQTLIELVTPLCDFVVIRSDGNRDGDFTKITNAKKIPLYQIEKNAELTAVLEAMFK